MLYLIVVGHEATMKFQEWYNVKITKADYHCQKILEVMILMMVVLMFLVFLMLISAVLAMVRWMMMFSVCYQVLDTGWFFVVVEEAAQSNNIH